MAKRTCVESAAVRLMMHYPFWCELYYTMKVIEDEHVGTLKTDGRNMWVNPTFWATLSLDHKVAALAHETMHKMLHHCTRGRNLDHHWANIAMDIVVNTMLHDNGFKIHQNWVQPEPRFRGWPFEAVYAEITKDIPPQPQGGSSAGQKVPKAQAGQKPADGAGEGEDDPQSGYCDGDGIPKKYRGAFNDVRQQQGSQEQLDHFEEQVEQQVQQALAQAKAMGNAPAGVEMAMEKVTKVAEERWYDHLQRFFQSMRISEYNWARTSRQHAVLYKVVAPTMFSPRLGKVMVFIDASGSVYEQAAQARFNMHMNTILSEAKPESVHVAYFDTIVHKHVEMEPGAIEFEETPAGGGGTSFTQLLPWMVENDIDPAVVIILTDMFGDFPKEEDTPPYPVIWASVTPDVQGPFGETIHIK
jgi:predicted metal-dependent peptidase